MNTLTKSLAVVLTVAGTAAAQELPKTAVLPNCANLPIVDCAPGFRPEIDHKTCTVRCVDEMPRWPGGDTRPAPFDVNQPEPPKCPGCTPLPKPEPHFPPPHKWAEDSSPLGDALDSVKKAIGTGDVESATNGLFKIWSGSAQPKFRKVSDDERDSKNGCKWGCDKGTAPEVPKLDWPKQKDAPRQEQPRQEQPRQEQPRGLPKQYDLPKSVIPNTPPSGTVPA